METESLVLARTLSGAAADDSLLPLLCQAAEQAITLRLRGGLSPADCGSVFSCAAALLATADWREAAERSEGLSFRAGEVSVSATPAAEKRRSAAGLRELAWRMMSPYVGDSGFCFRGVEA